MVCKACGTSFEPKHPKRAKFCSARCRVIAWRAEKEAEAIERAFAERDRQTTGLLKRVLVLLTGRGENTP